jgi:large subunit ribosomal protein L22
VQELVQVREQDPKQRNKMTNTEKPTTKAEGKKAGGGGKMKTIPTIPKLDNAPLKKTEEKLQEKKEEKADKKKSEKKVDIPKKTEAIINGKSLPISTKKSVAICKFISGKKLHKAIFDLEQVLTHKKVVPMKGEIPHQKGEGISSGRYPKKASEYFINLLKSLQANANVNGLEEPRIVEAIANLASRPYGKFGRVKKKRTHVQIKVMDKKKSEKKVSNKSNLNKKVKK